MDGIGTRLILYLDFIYVLKARGLGGLGRSTTTKTGPNNGSGPWVRGFFSIRYIYILLVTNYLYGIRYVLKVCGGLGGRLWPKQVQTTSEASSGPRYVVFFFYMFFIYTTN